MILLALFITKVSSRRCWPQGAAFAELAELKLATVIASDYCWSLLTFYLKASLLLL